MRPSKYITKGVAMLQELLKCEFTAQCLTDQNLFFCLNDMIVEKGEKPICYRTFQRYKAAATAYGELAIEEQELFDPMFQSLYHTIQRSQIKQKVNLYKAMMTAETTKEYHQYRWTLERKFPDFNLRKVSQSYIEEHGMLEKRMLSHDIDVTIRAMQRSIENYTAPVNERELDSTTNWNIKCDQQCHQEDQLKTTAEEKIPAHEKPAFELYWQERQAEWDIQNPPVLGEPFTKTAARKALHYWHGAMNDWGTVKGRYVR